MLIATLKNIWRTLRGHYWRVRASDNNTGYFIEFKRTGARQFEHLKMDRGQAIRAAKSFNELP